MADKKTILLSNVGNRDPYALDSQTEGSIITLTRLILPDIVYLFPTAMQPLGNYSNTEDNAERTRIAIKEILPAAQVFLRPLDLPDPTDYHRILNELDREVASLQETLKASRRQFFEYHVNISSGTPQMQTCWLLLINGSRIKARAWQIKDPKWGSDRCRVIETEFIEEQNKISRAQSFFESYMFKAAQDELEMLAAGTYLPGRAHLAEAISELCQAYLFWDLFQHEKALKHARTSYEAIKQFPEMQHICKKIMEQIETLEKILQSKGAEREINLVDLYHNAVRRKNSGQYVDCLARFRRLHEGCYFFQLRQSLKINPADAYGRQPKWIREQFNKTNYAFISLHEWRSFARRQKLEDPVSSYLEEEIRKFNQQRNQSIAAHGMGSVTEDEAAESLGLAKKFLLSFFSDRDIDRYCFGERALGELSKIIFKAL